VGEIADLIREMWPRVHGEHPGYDAERGECVDCPLELERIEHQAELDRLAEQMKP
jgi:hypothetical protein